MKSVKICLVILALASFFAVNPAPAQAQSAPLPAVSVATIEKKPAVRPVTYLGRIEAIHATDIMTRTEGFIESVGFVEGQMVKEGQLLFQIDGNVHLSAIDQAKAVVASAEASLNLAEVMYRRLVALARNNATSQAEADRALAERDVAQATVAQAQATLRARELDLSFTKITAPLAGRVGHTRFDVGSFINQASGPLVNVVQLDPIRVVISIREHDFISAMSQNSEQNRDRFIKEFAPQLRLANGQLYPTRGVFDSLDNQINPLTGTVDVRARFANPDGVLLPGGAVEVTLDAAEPPLAPMVPIAALQRDMNGFFVLVVDKDNVVEMRPIEVGHQIDQNFVVTKGLAEGERVIVEGLQRVAPGRTVNPLPLTPPTN